MQIIQDTGETDEFGYAIMEETGSASIEHLEYCGQTISRPEQLTFGEILSADYDYDPCEVDELWRYYG